MTLTEVSYYTHKYMPAAILSFLLVLILYYSIEIFMLIIKPPNTTSVYTNPVFGKISPIEMETASPSGNLSYTLDTIEGQPITATGSASVFFLPQFERRFNSMTKVSLMAKTIGIDTDKINYKFIDNNTVKYDDGMQQLFIDTTNYNFHYEYNFKADTTFMSLTNLPDDNLIKNNASDFLRKIDRYPSELAQGKTNLIYFTYDATASALVTNKILQNSSNMAEVDFYRPDVTSQNQTYPMVLPKYFNSQDYVVIAYFNDGPRVVRAQVHFFEKSTDQIGVYPLISGDQAWKDLQAGNALYANVPDGITDFTIKQMFLGYLDPDTYQPYLQPVYVFLGDNDFVAYVPAVSREWIGKQDPNTAH